MNWERHFRNMKPARPRASFGADAAPRKVGRMGDLGVHFAADMIPLGTPDTADLQAIYVYVESKRPLIPQFPAIQTLIQSFETWYEGLGYWDLNIMANATLAEAIRRRDQINAATGDVLPASWIPADTGVAQPGAASGLAGQVPSAIPEVYKVAAIATGVGVLTLAVLKKLAFI
jgi:hypothetical protein